MSAAANFTRSRLPVARRNDVGMYTVTAAMPRLPSRAQIALARVGKDGDDELTRRHLRGHLTRREYGGAGRSADEQAFFPREPSRPREGVLVAHEEDPVDDRAVEDPGHERRSDPLDRVRPGPAA